MLASVAGIDYLHYAYAGIHVLRNMSKFYENDYVFDAGY